ncbi:hypothetical protein [Entomospira culicis]|uniref:Uncharacterized protein n=1 Tax=Entomospira culicis TaxID=2719989 RepID=A0A968KUP8_9SPIO|nr:hypothetical protein [Entomospira culicis]NIZ19136.1 hypothetical protein [Entomospira culicis]NIZ69350.1 hypothetical protein [Entomospira culicis]WDI37936.1 hypothetical protein PVA46_03870 [Entomospira culicis]WDI39563.1 hypothetical protein PVA47_03870 [Entomospira culicis]
MKSYRYKGSWLSLRKQKRLRAQSIVPLFSSYRINLKLNKIKKRYHFTFTNPRNLTAFSPIQELRFPRLYPQLAKTVQQEDKNYFFIAGMIDHLRNGEAFFIGISQRTLEWLDIYTVDHQEHITHYRYHIFDRYWKDTLQPYEAMQIHATINIYLDEILYLVARNTIYSPFRATLKLPNPHQEPYNPYKMMQI